MCVCECNPKQLCIGILLKYICWRFRVNYVVHTMTPIDFGWRSVFHLPNPTSPDRLKGDSLIIVIIDLVGQHCDLITLLIVNVRGLELIIMRNSRWNLAKKNIAHFTVPIDKYERVAHVQTYTITSLNICYIIAFVNKLFY